jgi:hypothetical protein
MEAAILFSYTSLKSRVPAGNHPYALSQNIISLTQISDVSFCPIENNQHIRSAKSVNV